MTDVHTPAQRSKNMASIRGKDTTPELRVRSALHRAGYRFRLHRKDIPGKPDIVMPGRKIAIFVHGCYWHRHPGCKYATIPKSSTDFWQEKFKSNIARDKKVAKQIKEIGWRRLVIWECETKEEQQIQNIIIDFLASNT